MKKSDRSLTPPVSRQPRRYATTQPFRTAQPQDGAPSRLSTPTTTSLDPSAAADTTESYGHNRTERPFGYAYQHPRVCVSERAITADISKLTEARLVTGRDIPGDVVRIRNGCAQTTDGAIAVAEPRRTAASNAASRPY